MKENEWTLKRRDGEGGGGGGGGLCPKNGKTGFFKKIWKHLVFFM